MMKTGSPISRYLKFPSRRNKSKCRYEHDGSVTASSVSIVESLMDAGSVLNQDFYVSPPTRKTATVRFDETLNAYHENTMMPFEEIDELWYPNMKCKQMKDDYNNLTRTVIRSNLSPSGRYIFALETIYRTSQRGKTLSPKKEQELMSRLEGWGAQGVGLQFRYLEVLIKDKNQRKARKLDILQNFPRRIRNYSNDELQEEVARRCQEISKPAVLFAIQLAKIPPRDT